MLSGLDGEMHPFFGAYAGEHERKVALGVHPGEKIVGNAVFDWGK